MSPAADPALAASRLQQRALEASTTVWVAASAGTGKTKVLVDRVLALLLAGSAPERILCLTFTKAAAAEMANRLLQRLSAWATLDEVKLEAQLDALLGRHPSAGEQAAARRLFARVLDTPGGLKIQTIHAFCQSLLARFPLEAGIPPHAEVIEERTAGELLHEAQQELLATAAAEPQGPLYRALDRLLLAAGDQALGKTLDAVVARREALEQTLARHGGLGGAIAVHRALLDLQEGEDAERLLAAALDESLLPTDGLRQAVAALQQGGKSDLKLAERLAAFLALPAAARATGYDDYCRCFLTGEGTVRVTLMTKAAAARAPDVAALLAAEAARILALESRLAAVRVAERTDAVLTLGHAVLERYRRAKESRGLLDYGDLIERTGRLLAAAERVPWVLYKLDGGLDHLLIDEAQDTSPAQWAVVKALTAEFYVGAGAHEDASPVQRTVFTVGDPKQSIFRFQGADPQGFFLAERHYQAAADAVGRPWDKVELAHSFRSVEAVLGAVDRVFQPPAMRAGLVGEGEVIRHLVTRLRQGGLVELWPLLAPEPLPETEPWTPPVTRGEAKAPEVALAQQIARTLRGWLNVNPATIGPRTAAPDHPAWLTSKGRPLEAGDLLILVRRRRALFHALVRELKKAGVPVTGVDRMVLTEQLAVRDLVALGRFLLLPEDELTLAVVLKGPLGGLDDDDLLLLTAEPRRPLWQALGERRHLKPAYAAVWEELAGLLERADFVPPFELYAGLLAAGGGRRRWLARLGEEASDPLDEFLAQALAYERDHPPSLEGFLDWLEQGELEVKRDLESGGGAVRIMTVHGAKGLQAPVVILPDTVALPDPRQDLLAEPERALLLPWSGDLKATPLGAQLIAAEQAAVEAEYRRLLYVAMTRAEDRLYLAGCLGRRKLDPRSWYACIEAALVPGAQRIEVEGLGAGWRLATPQRKAERAAPPQRPLLAPLGGFAFAPPPPEPTPPRPLAPSRPAAEEPVTLSPIAPGGARRFRRGLAIHRLLQSLPELPPDQRPAAARRFLALPGLGGEGQGLSPAEQEAWAAEVLAVMGLPEAAPLFAPGSRAEVPLVGLVGDLRIAGQIDRLAVTPAAVLVADYKTNRPPPASEAEVPALYRRQMAAYRALLRQLYPGRAVKCFLVWTDGPRLMQLGDENLAEALP